jgi:hypothetical protein
MEPTVNRKVLTGWDGLIQDADQKIDAAKRRVFLLRKAAKDLRRIRDSGQPWPGAQSQARKSATRN